MCTPEAYIATQVLSGFSKYRSARREARDINTNTEAKQETIRNEAIYKDNALIRQAEVKEDQLSAQKEDLQTKAIKSQSTAKLAFFEKGIGGNIYNSVIGDIDRQAGKASNRIDQNMENFIRANTENRLAYNRQFTNQLLDLPRAYKPSFISYALPVASNIGTMYMSNQAPATPDMNSINFNPDGST